MQRLRSLSEGCSSSVEDIGFADPSLLPETRTVVLNAFQLQPGDHIAQPGALSTPSLPYWHHAVVVGVADEVSVMVIHNTNVEIDDEGEDSDTIRDEAGSSDASYLNYLSRSTSLEHVTTTDGGSASKKKAIGRVQAGFVSLFLFTPDGKRRAVPTYRCDYADQTRAYNGELAVERAFEKLDECTLWSPLYNCEHFATWCKTGRAECRQYVALIKAAGQRVAGMAGASMARAATSAVIKRCADKAAASSTSIGQRLLSVLPARSGGAAATSTAQASRTAAAPLAASVVVELGVASWRVKNAFGQYQRREITWTDLKKKLLEEGVATSSSLSLGTVGSLIGSSACAAVPPLVPFGLAAGGFIGSALGRAAGSIGGTKVANALIPS